MKILIDLSMLAKANDYVLTKTWDKYRVDDLLKAVHKNIHSIVFEATMGKRAEIVLCLDSKNNFRKTIFPQYKGSRVYDGAYQERLEYIKDNLDFDKIEMDGLEADDVIFLNAEQGDIIVSSDHDLKQCGVKMMSPQTKKWLPMGFTSKDYWDTILRGCKSDEVPKLVNVMTAHTLAGFSAEYDREQPIKMAHLLYDHLAIESSEKVSRGVGFSLILRNIELLIFSKTTYKKHNIDL